MGTIFQTSSKQSSLKASQIKVCHSRKKKCFNSSSHANLTANSPAYIYEHIKSEINSKSIFYRFHIITSSSL